MKGDVYQRILATIQSNCQCKYDCLKKLKKLFPGFHDDTLHSIYSQQLQRKIKSNNHKHHQPEIIRAYYERFMMHIENNEATGILLKIAEEVDFPPVMIARIVLSEYLKTKVFKDDKTVPKSHVSMLLKNTSVIKENKIAEEIELCLKMDDDCGPENDAVKRAIGEEYEQKLRQILIRQNIPFVDEETLRKQGYDKTPDFKLEVPIAVDGFVVNWLESKASFGDEESHSAYLKDQLWSYTNRFGPGMIIYWFGFIDELDINLRRGICMRDEFPDKFVTLDLLI